jgi:hypothetical protein
MKIYVSSDWENKENVRGVMARLRRNGHTIVGDWTGHADTRPYARNPYATGEQSWSDIEAVIRCEAFLLLARGSTPAESGMHTELGAALVSMDMGGCVQRILVVGPGCEEHFFYFCPHVERFADIDDAIRALNQWDDAMCKGEKA